MYKKRSYRRKAPARKYRKRVYKKSSFAKRVKKVLHSNVETKIINSMGNQQTLAYAGSVTNPTFFRLLPGPSQGVAQGQRIGNEIRVTKASINGFLYLKSYNAISNNQNFPIYVKMWLCRRKATNIVITGDPSTTDFSRFFQDGSSSLGFQSNMLDMVLQPNKDYWTVYATKTVQLSNSLFFAGGTTAVTPSNGNTCVPFYFNLTKHLGLCKYADNVANIPINKELFLVHQICTADGQTLGALDAVRSTFQTQYEYEDA